MSVAVTMVPPRMTFFIAEPPYARWLAGANSTQRAGSAAGCRARPAGLERKVRPERDGGGIVRAMPAKEHVVKVVGVDVGGTFTDVVLADLGTGTLTVEKLPTTPHDPSEAVVDGIARLADPGELAEVRHGTTIATNTMLTASGARVGIVTTEGFRDVLHLARHQRPQHYSIRQEVPWQDRPLATRAHRKTVRERLVPPRGEVLVPLDEDGVRAAARELRDEGVEAVAVCFLFSYLDPVHEERAAELVREEHPDAFVTTSSSVYPQFREFERFTTAAANAYVGPPVRAYLERLAERAAQAGFGGRIHVMRSNGGVAPVAQAAREPVTLLLSGPAAGVLGGAHAGRASGRDHLVTFDVGGTSADIGVVTGSGLAEASARDTFIAGFPIMAPMLDLATIGAGGGSIAYVDEGGAFRVGPALGRRAARPGGVRPRRHGADGHRRPRGARPAGPGTLPGRRDAARRGRRARPSCAASRSGWGWASRRRRRAS